MYGVTLLIIRAKSKYPRECHIINTILDAFGGPIEGKLSCIIIERRMELGKDLFIPIIPKAHDIIKTKLSALCNHFIEEWIIESLKVSPIHILARDNWCLALVKNQRGIEILMQRTPKPSF
jgi:hypothetical protein